MTTTEFWLAWLFNFKAVFEIVAAGSGIALAGIAIVYGVNFIDWREDDFRTKCTVLLRRVVVVFAVSAFFACIPSPGDLWKLRVNLLKLEVASPENLNGAKEHLEVIVKGLECKYLNENCPKVEAK